MRQKITLPILATALLLVAATLGTASCSQNDDALPAGTAVARGGEPLNICIAPKPGYTESANTRATVNDDTGAFAWEAGDEIRVRIIFNDAAATEIFNTWTYTPGNTTGLFNDWFTPVYGAHEDVAKLTWPLGASSATVTACHCDMEIFEDADLSLSFDYTGSTGDYMLFSKTLSLGEDLTIDFAHGITRLVFTGLAANTDYRLKAAGAEFAFPIHITHELTTIDMTETKPFTSDASGNLTVCADLDEKIDANGKLKLELVKNGETAAVYQTTLMAQGTPGAYKMNGYIYKIKVSSGGKVNPENNPNLVAPAPIIPGNTVWELNGYYITAPDADVNKFYRWSASESATVMDNDPCAGHGNWRIPTMKDFEKMAGWTETWPWSQDAGTDFKQVLSNEDIWYTAFGRGGYQYVSTDVVTSSETQVWYVISADSGPIDPDNTGGSRGSCYFQYAKTEEVYCVRCVQLK